MFYFYFLFFFFNDTATTEIYTLSLHDALPIYPVFLPDNPFHFQGNHKTNTMFSCRSEEHTSELQSHHELVCRPLLEKKKKKKTNATKNTERLKQNHALHKIHSS